MSCQIKLSANIVNHLDIRNKLFPSDNSNSNESWLQLCELSVSPCGDIIAIARDKQLVILSGKWDANNSRNNYYETCYLDFTETITSVLCLPIVAQGKSSQVGPDWTCIVIGFQSGYVRFYTEDCMLLLEEQLDNENVVTLKCQSHHSPRPDISPNLKQEEFYVQYPSNVCVINGQSLFSTLRNCRSYLAKVVSGTVAEPTNISLNPKKWGFTDQNVVADAAVVGLDLANTFDHLLTASTCGGFETRYRAMPPHSNLVLGAGNKPYLGFHYALEGGTQPVFSDVAKAVASKIKSALPGWMTGAKNQVEKPAVVTFLPAEAMACRFGLCDLRRTALHVIVSPEKKYGAVTDSLGRVLLVETQKGIAVRIFKGYRDAQCAFIQVPDERKSKTRIRKAGLFLVIYSPKKGTLEIFSAPLGVKVATFTASKHSRLVYINYGLMGVQHMSKTRYICQYTTVFIDGDGSLKEIIVPFHFALSENNSAKSRDLHLYKRLKQFTKTLKYTKEELFAECFNTCSELKTGEAKLQVLDFMCSNKDVFPEIILKCGSYFIENISNLNANEVGADVRLLEIQCINLCSLVNFYNYVITYGEEDTNGNLDVEPVVVDTKSIIPDRDMKNLQKLLDLSSVNNFKNSPARVSFADNGHETLSAFIKIFLLNNPDHISLKLDADETALFEISRLIFKKYVTHKCNYTSLKENIKSSNIVVDDLFRLLLLYWENRELIDMNLDCEMQNFSTVVYALAQNAKSAELVVDYNLVSPFWATIRLILMNSSKAFPALMAAIICKSIAQHMQGEEQIQAGADEDLEVWEELSQETCQWILLKGKLEDVSLLNIITSTVPLCSKVLPQLKHTKEDVSLKQVLQRGKGSVSEVVARWLTSGGIDPDLLPLNDRILQNNTQEITDDENAFEIDLEKLQSEAVFENLNVLRKQFPYSLESNVLLTNMCWEYALAWKKQLGDMKLLDASIRCMNQITNPQLRAGLHHILWNTHLKHLFEMCCRLVNIVGKTPKEKLCLQDTGLSDKQLSEFTEKCPDFFDTWMDAVRDSYTSEAIVLNYEDIWEDDRESPLTQLAVAHSDVNYNLLLLHFQMAELLHMIVKFHVKHAKFINTLFDPPEIPLCFSDLQQNREISFRKGESKTNTSRLNFLLKVLIATVETITVDGDKLYCADHVTWMVRCVNLARMWDLDVDVLRRYQVVRLYINGFDVLAQESLLVVSELEHLGPDLLEVAGRRLRHELNTAESLAETIVVFSTTLTHYIKSLGSEWCAPTPIEKTLSLCKNCIRCFKEGTRDYKLAELMIETSVALKKQKKNVVT